MDMLSHFRHFYVGTRQIRASRSSGCRSVRSVTGSIERAVAREDCCGDSLPLRLEAPISTLKRVVLKVLQP